MNIDRLTATLVQGLFSAYEQPRRVGYALDHGACSVQILRNLGYRRNERPGHEDYVKQTQISTARICHDARSGHAQGTRPAREMSAVMVLFCAGLNLLYTSSCFRTAASTTSPNSGLSSVAMVLRRRDGGGQEQEGGLAQYYSFLRVMTGGWSRGDREHFDKGGAAIGATKSVPAVR